MRRKDPKNVCWVDLVKSAIERRKVLGGRDEGAKEEMYRSL